MQINSLSWSPKSTKGSYFFSKYPLIWGWATWRDRWNLYDYKVSELDSFLENDKIKSVTSNKKEISYHLKTFANKEADTWDYQWKFTIFNNDGLCVTPNQNLIRNIGFGEDATHTTNENSDKANLEIGEIKFPITHPKRIERNTQLDKKYYSTFLFLPLWKRIINKFSSLKRTRID